MPSSSEAGWREEAVSSNKGAWLTAAGTEVQGQLVAPDSPVHLPRQPHASLSIPLLYQGGTLALEDFLRLRIQTSLKFYCSCK